MASRATTTTQLPPAPNKDQDPYKFNLSVKQILDKWGGNAGLLDTVITFRDLQDIVAGNFEFTNIRSLSKIQYIDGGVVRTGRITSYDAGTYFDLDYDKIVMNAKITFDSTVTGVFIGRDGADYKVNIGDATEYVKWDGTNISWKGTYAELTSTGALKITSGTVGPSSGAARIFLDGTNLRISVYDATDAEKVAMGYLGGLAKNDGTGNWTSSNYGFWAVNGDSLSIDGDAVYYAGDWIVKNDASYLIQNAAGNTIIKLGTDTGEKGLFLYNASGTNLAKYTTDTIYIGTSGETANYMKYTVAGGLVIQGSVTISGNLSSLSSTTGALTVNGTLSVGASIILGTSGNIYTDGKTSYADTDAGVFFGYDTSTYKFNIGDATHFFKWSGTAIEIYGAVAMGSLTLGSAAASGRLTLINGGVSDTYIAAGKTDFTTTESGLILGLDYSDSNKAKLYMGNSTQYMYFNGSNLVLSDSLIITNYVAEDNITRIWTYTSESGWIIAENDPYATGDYGHSVANTESFTPSTYEFIIWPFLQSYFETFDNAADTVHARIVLLQAIDIVLNGVLKWVQSTYDSNSYYCTTISDTDPGFPSGSPACCLKDAQSGGGKYADSDALPIGSASLTYWDYGDYDSLGYSTAYVRVASDVDPNTLDDGELRMAWVLQTYNSPYISGYVDSGGSGNGKIHVSPVFFKTFSDTLKRSFIFSACYIADSGALGISGAWGTPFCCIDQANLVVLERKK